MAPAFQTVALSLVYLLWSALRRAERRLDPPPAAQEQPPAGDEHVERRLDCLTVLVKPIPHRR
jgi:hypothetical protein